jgi:hypothetical protein
LFFGADGGGDGQPVHDRHLDVEDRDIEFLGALEV